ncbi:hypothetical protein [Occallatibacter riparius]|uniref:Uncharacterized protein n=1 Tax=Occallatibacter riparius TaxID=1002689 RepID=A0A9J7BHR9_9BACT|nr:hypothetical protein [Occallatibacter riparius]UWZ81987.1 hypothetical protein MOP44_15550 [Occallatibacter riparius]
MVRKSFAFLCLLIAAVTASAQVLETKICDVLAHPSAFDGKVVRLTGTVIAGFDEFAVKNNSCNQAINSIWITYPAGTKAKAGPAAMLTLQLAKNSPGDQAAPKRTPVTLDANKDFKQFDSLLSAQAKFMGRCLGCVRSTVTATLTGRIDAVDQPALERTGKMFTAVRGFGNLNRYPARIVLQSVSNVIPGDIDYSKPATLGDGQVELGLTADLPARAATAFGAEGEQNGVGVDFDVTNTLRKDDGGKGSVDSPDGLLLAVYLDGDRLKELALSEAMAHMGTHIADLREKPNGRSLSKLEAHAWSATILAAVNQGEKLLTLPGGYVLWNQSWSEAERQKALPGALSGFLTDWAGFGR